MPTMTNHETGETREISMEEFMELMRGNEGTLQQIVKNADGTTSSTTLYGNITEDGLDHSVNIFIDDESFNAFVIRGLKKLTGEIENSPSEEDPDELFEMTVDFTDSALMGILTKTKDALSINLYTRDERKATFDHLRQEAKTWKVNPDSTLEFNVADLQGEDKTVTLFMLSFIEMRKFLRASGNLAELKKLGNRGSGVIIEATEQADDAEATIVRGRNRPDLPCNVFLLGEQMMRPYMDEFMSNMLISGMSLEEKVEAAENGDPDIMEYLAQIYLNGDEDVEQDFEKSAYWWEKLANTGNSIGQFNIGLHYAKGCGVERDFSKAAAWMKKAAENGDDDAPNVAALYDGAAEKLNKAENGDPVAQAEIAKLYMQIGGSLNQFGTQHDYEESFKWAKKAAAQGDLDGMYCLALCYEHGRGTLVNAKLAADTYEKAAKAGHAPSQWNYAVCYFNGIGRDIDWTTAYTWAYQSADQGYELAINGLSLHGKTIDQVIETYKDAQREIKLERTQYDGRADRCENLRSGTRLRYKFTEENNHEVLELFHNNASVGVLHAEPFSEVIALLRLDRIELDISVLKCIPKSQRGNRARSADVDLLFEITEKKPETPEERANRLAKEEAQRKAEEERMRREAEAKRKAEEERKQAEKLRKEKEAAEKAEAERIAKQKAKELQEAAAKMRSRYITASGMIACSGAHVVAVKPDGTVVATGDNYFGQCNVSGWRDVIAVACESGATVGLTSHGTVLYTGSGLHRERQCMSWTGIKEIAIATGVVFGLKHDGTVVATSETKSGASYSTKPDVTTWRNIVAIRTGGVENVLGIKSDGNIVAIGRNYLGRCVEEYYLDGKTNVQDAAYGFSGGVVLHKNGKCTSVGSNVFNPTKINTHSGIVKVDMLSGRPIAILADGTLVIEPGDKRLDDFIKRNNIKKVAAVSCGALFVVLTADGRVFVKCDSVLCPINDEECFGKNFRLFDDFNKMMDNREAKAERIKKEKEEQERRRKEEERRRADYRLKGLCQHCGGKFEKVLFGKKCSSCGKKKDY